MEIQSGNIFIRPNTLHANDCVQGHTHNFDHTTFLFSGAMRVRATGPYGEAWEKTFTAPAHVLIRADWMHELTGLQDNTVFWCVYAHRTPQGDVVQEATGFDDAYR
jgi:hypothetical protein